MSGFSPSQWVLGYQPHVPGDLLSDGLGPQHLDGNSSFEDVLARRNAAKAALLDVDFDMRLRRALLRRYEGDNSVLQTGQLCFYWRDARAADLVKIRRHGPAKVMIREDGPDGKPSVYWLAFKTQLIRCAPNHVRPDFTNSSQTLLGNLQEAKRHLQQLKSRGVTRYLDLNVANKRNIDDVDEEDQSEAPLDFDGDFPPDDPDDPQEPPRQRRRLTPLPRLDSADDLNMDFVPDSPSYAPTTPAGPEDGLDSPPVNRSCSLKMFQSLKTEHFRPMMCKTWLTHLRSIPSGQVGLPSAPSGAAAPAPLIATGPLALDPEVAKLYEPAQPGEDFLNTRRRVDIAGDSSFPTCSTTT